MLKFAENFGYRCIYDNHTNVTRAAKVLEFVLIVQNLPNYIACGNN